MSALAEGEAITLFTTAKAFRGHVAVIQENAFRSWKALDPSCEVLVFGSDEGSAEICDELSFRHVPDVKTTSGGVPYVSDMFAEATRLASNEVLCFVNADIILPPTLPLAAWRLSATEGRFLAVGRRVDLDVVKPVNFDDPEWWKRLEQRAKLSGKRRGDLAIDWFLFRRGQFIGLPDFAVGRTSYDNWLIWRAASEGATVVDASAFVPVVHQNHDYGHVGGELRAWEGADAQVAHELLGHWSHYHSISHASRVLDSSGGLVPARGWRYRSARPRRVLAHLLRFSRPLRRRLRLLRSRRRAGPFDQKGVVSSDAV